MSHEGHEIHYRDRETPLWNLIDAYAVVKRPGQRTLILGPYSQINLNVLSAKAENAISKA